MGIKGFVTDNTAKNRLTADPNRATSSVIPVPPPITPEDDIVGYTKARLPKKVIYTGAVSDTASVIIDNNPESSTYAQIRVEVNSEAILSKIAAGDPSISVVTESDGSTWVKLQLSLDEGNIAEIRDDGLFVAQVDTSQFATKLELQMGLDTKQNKLTAGDNITITTDGEGHTIISSTNGTIDYNELINKPLINGVELSGSLSLADLGIATKTSELENDSGFISAEQLIPGEGISIIEESDGSVTISNTQTSAEWGKISGDIEEQTDLINMFDSKQNILIAGRGINIDPSSEGDIISSHTIVRIVRWNE